MRGHLGQRERHSFSTAPGQSLSLEPFFGDCCTRDEDNFKTFVTSNFLTLCVLGFRWPYSSDNIVEDIIHKRDKHCDMAYGFIDRCQQYGVPARDNWPAKVNSSSEIGCRLCFE